MSLAIAMALMAQASPLATAADDFLLCMQHEVQTAMIAHMTPAEFAAAFPATCKTEEKGFRTEAIKAWILRGKSPEAAASDADANIANSRQTFIASQATYFASATAGPAAEPTPAQPPRKPTKRTAKKPRTKAR